MDLFSVFVGVWFGGLAVFVWFDRQQASAARRVADRALVLAQPGTFFAWDFMRQHGWTPGRFYPLIDRMEDAGEVSGAFEHNPLPGKRPRRLYWVVRVHDEPLLDLHQG